MKKTRTFLFAFIIFLLPFHWVSAQCELDISDLIIEAYPCDSDGNFLVDIDFNYSGGTDSFTVSGNGMQYGTFAYSDLYITLGPFNGDGSTVYEFIFQDTDNFCAAFGSVGPVNCGSTACGISNISMDNINCNDNWTYNFVLDFDFEGINNDYFDVFANGQFFGYYSFANVPLAIQNFPQSGNANDVITICQNDDPNCCEVFEFPSPNCSNNNCEIWDLVVEAHPCTPNNIFYVDLDFNSANTSDSFMVVGNGTNYGTFSYDDLFITLGPFAGDGSTLEFIVIDQNNPDCSQEVGLVSPDCTSSVCDFNELVVEAHNCDDNDFFLVDVDFNYFNASDSFDIFINGDGPDDYYGTYAYSDLYVTIGPFEGNGQFIEFLVVDQNDQTCYSTTTIQAPDCTPNNCEIWDLVAEAHACDDNGNILVDLDFNFANTSDSFMVVGNGTNYGTFSYDELFLTLGPLEGNGSVYEFIVIDQNNPDCTQEVILESPDCNAANCEVGEITVDIIGCNPDGTYDLVLNFTHANATNDFFDVFANGAFFGFFELADLPVTIEGFPATGNTHDIIQVCINDNANCCESLEFEAPNCGGSCIEFDDLTAGTFYGTPQYADDDLIFSVGGVPVKIQDFEWAGTTQFNGAFVLDNSLPQNMYPNFDGNFMAPADANLEFNFLQLTGVVIHLEFDFYNSGGEINIGANDAPLIEGTSLFDLDGTEIAPGVTITIVPDANDPLVGKAIIEGFVGFLTLGGSDAFFFDNICYELATFGNIWPGDTNTDNFCSNFDLLNIGLAYGATGEARVDPTIGWLPQPANDWDQNFQNDVNFKHADTNGDGVINASDKFAIEENFGLTHGITNPYISPIPNPGDPALFVIMPPAMDIGLGTFEAEIHLGDDVNIVDGIHGLAFTFEFNDQIFDASSMQIIFEDGWLNDNGNDDLLSMQHQENGEIHTAVTRINQLNISGSGKIGKITGIIDDLSGYAEIEFHLNQVKGIKTNEDIVPFETPDNYVELQPNGIENPEIYQIKIYPNPADDVIFVKNDYDLPIEEVRMVNILGQEIKINTDLSSNLIEVNVNGLAQGIYFLEIQFSGFSVSKKIEISHK